MRHVPSLSMATLLCIVTASLSAQDVDSVEVTPHDVVRPVSQNTGSGVGACQQFMPWAYGANGARIRRELTYVWSVSNSADFQIDTITGVACARLTGLPDTVTTVVTATIAGTQISGTANFSVTPDPTAPGPVAGLPQAGEGALDTTLLSPGPAPTNVTVTPISPTALQIAWTGVTGASGYQIYRAPSAGGSFTALTRAPVQGNQTTDPTLMPKTTAYYKVSALVPNQRESMSAAVSGTTPPAPNPASLSATLAADLKSVILSWPAPTGASGYQLYKGGGLVSTTPLRTTSYTDTALVLGTTYKYQVAALYTSPRYGEFEGDLLTMPKAIVAVRAAVVRAVPSHGTSWLTKNNGPGSPDEAGKYYDAIGATGNFDTFAKWKAAHGFSARDQVSAVYFNDGDLALGRDMHCREAQGKLACYVSNYGPEPGTPGFPNPEQALAAAIARGTPLATVAMERSLQTLEHGFTVEDTEGDVDTGLDIQPDDHVTITAWGGVRYCHGDGTCGELKSVAGKEQSACQPSLPAPCLREFALLGKLDGYFYIGTRFFGYPTIRRPSRLFVRVNSGPGYSAERRPNWNNAHNPIAALIDGLYGGGVDVAGRMASDDWVPGQWAAKPNVYDAVVKRYCRTCHLALREELDFTSAAQFQAVASRIQSAVCYLRSMPHAEVPFRKLWLSELPHLPGYLEDPSVLGVKCVSP